MVRLSVFFIIMLSEVFTLAAQPLKSMVVRDANGKLVGQLLDNEESRALMRYRLTGGDNVLLEATPFSLRSALNTNLIFVGSSDCTGVEAYLRTTATSTFMQLTQRQALVLNRFSSVSPLTVVSSLLYLSDKFPTFVSLPGPPTSQYAVFPSGFTCLPLAPDDDDGNPIYIRVVRSEDLTQKFTPPFWAD